MPIRRDRVSKPKPFDASPPPPPGNEGSEIETMLRRLEELRRAASNRELRGAFAAAIDALDAVLYRLAMLRRLEPPKRSPLGIAPPPTPKAATSARTAAARIGAVRKPRR